MTSEYIIGTAAAVLSLAFTYVPKLKDWYEKQSGEVKQLIMLALLFGVVAFAFGMACAGQASELTCDSAGVWEGLRLFVLAVLVNQGVYKATDYIRTNKDAEN